MVVGARAGLARAPLRFDLVVPEALPAWVRVRVANALATDGKHWGALVARHNSGTYNNQFLVVNAGRFEPRSALREGTLTVVEQVPGLVRPGES